MGVTIRATGLEEVPRGSGGDRGAEKCGKYLLYGEVFREKGWLVWNTEAI